LPKGQEGEMVTSSSPSTGQDSQPGTSANVTNNDSKSTTEVQTVKPNMTNTEATDQTNQALQSVGLDEQGSEPMEVEASMEEAMEQTTNAKPSAIKGQPNEDGRSEDAVAAAVSSRVILYYKWRMKHHKRLNSMMQHVIEEKDAPEPPQMLNLQYPV